MPKGFAAKGLQLEAAAPLSPGVTRRFPFSAALRTRLRVSFRRGGGQIGEIANDYQSQRALGLDTSNRALGVFGGAIARDGGREQCGRRRDIGNYRGAGCARQICQTRLAPLEEISPTQID